MQGLVHIYTGDGKGKTTAAIGLGIRALGRGMKVLMIQFLKGSNTGEILILENLKPDFQLYRHKELHKFTNQMNSDELAVCRDEIRSSFQYAIDAARSGIWNLIILDEIMATISIGAISTGEAVSLIENKPEELELVLTGRNAPDELIQRADYVSEIHAVKHPMNRGIKARKGIEY
jgi:cob(I)alamin adenosyltransferase